MNPMDSNVPARRNVPIAVAIIAAALLALGLAFVWPG